MYVGLTITNQAAETVDTPKPAEGQVLLRVDVVSLDPAMRGWLRDVRSYVLVLVLLL